jgi:hypothetical protein
MTRLPILVTLTFAGMLAVLGGSAVIAQQPDKYSVQVPNGLSMSEFRGYEDWQVVAVSQTDQQIKAIVANPVMIAAYRAGIPRNGKPFPDGAKAAKIEWKPKKNAEAPYNVNVPDVLQEVAFIEKDSKRFANSNGWGFAPFNFDAATGKYTPDGTGTACGAACHTAAKTTDYIFTAYGQR